MDVCGLILLMVIDHVRGDHVHDMIRVIYHDRQGCAWLGWNHGRMVYVLPDLGAWRFDLLTDL